MTVISQLVPVSSFGWKLPASARAYVKRIEDAVGCHIAYVSVGAERDACIRR